MDSYTNAQNHTFSIKKSVSTGFTFIELIVTIVILGILSSVALPRLIDLTDNATETTFNSFKATILSAAEMAHAQHVMLGTDPDEPIIINGQTINMLKGYPEDHSIGLLVDLQGYSHDSYRGWWYVDGNKSCRLDYNEVGWYKNPTKNYPNVTTSTAGC